MENLGLFFFFVALPPRNQITFIFLFEEKYHFYFMKRLYVAVEEYLEIHLYFVDLGYKVYRE